MNQVAHVPQQQNGALAALAQRLNIDESEVQSIVVNTLMKAKGGQQVSNEEFVTFLAIASEYKLNPLTKEVYAFSNRGAIQAIVSIDGWLKIINTHPQFDGMEFTDSLDANGRLASVTCKIYRKDRNRPTEVTEYMNECAGTSEPWKKWPARMLRHKATIQCARYAFGLSGIVDPDEADRIELAVQGERDISPVKETRAITQDQLPVYPQEKFDAKLSNWVDQIDSGSRTADDVIATLSSRYQLTGEQINTLKNTGAPA
tara:strand:- start:195 stop:971 length:777 start_codon:yes stop_codon:yes gene_type:complete